MSNRDEQSATTRTRKKLERFASRLKQLLESDDDEAKDKKNDEQDEESLEAEALMIDAAEARASDVHIDPLGDGYRLRYRIDGAIVDVTDLSEEQGLKVVNQFRALARLDPIRALYPESGRFSYTLDDQVLDLRVTEAPCIAGDKLSIRLLASDRVLEDIQDLGLNEKGASYLADWLETVGGLMLTAGPTGSGKTTTLYALLHRLKMTDAEVITLEQPVEYEIPGINQIPVNIKQGLDFATGAKGMLRLDPDYLVIGELRDEASAEAAINAAAGGRATMASLHARDAIDTVTVLRNYGLDDFEIASNLDLVVAQRLVRRLCPDCSVEREPGERARAWMDSLELDVPESVHAAEGCDACGGVGYRGRIGIFEIWRPTEDDYGRIVKHEHVHALRAGLAERGHSFLLDDGMRKVGQGLISVDDLRKLGALGASTAQHDETLLAR
ncbi:MAG TPA: ATPase, T2SS/T4P/T4SS family [Wenzhouxiangellaceae bacterium]|nr:ATPase, T2SS/T4P/T4SS family [Wenzhouxiangellaceae bacterium]